MNNVRVLEGYGYGQVRRGRSFIAEYYFPNRCMAFQMKGFFIIMQYTFYLLKFKFTVPKLMSTNNIFVNPSLKKSTDFFMICVL